MRKIYTIKLNDTAKNSIEYDKFKATKKWFKATKPLFGGLVETHVKQSKSNKFINNIMPGWLFEDNYGFSELGKIWFLWHPSVKVVVIGKSLQMISCQVTLPDTQEVIVVSIVYGSNCNVTRKELWAELISLAADQKLCGLPWIVLGDFNQILAPQEHSAPPSLNYDKATRLFRDCVLDADISDLNFRGSTYTWWNKRKSAPVAKKLDRALVNDHWRSLFPASVVFFEAPEFSDHASIRVVLHPDGVFKKRPFKFFNFLLLNNNFVSMVASRWLTYNLTGSAMFRVSKKLKLLKKDIREFSKDNFSGIEKRTKEAHDALCSAQLETLAAPTVSNASNEEEALRKWAILSQAEEAFFFQRSRVQWMGLGDCSTRFYHQMVATRKSLNHVHYLLDDSGNRIDSQDNIEQHCIQYFSNLLGSEVGPPMFEQSDINLLFNFRCSNEDSQGFMKKFTPQDVKDAFFSLPKNKTSGPDGYSAEFFTSCWQFIGPEITEAVLEFFSSGQILKQWNSTSLVLIPKITNATRTTDFRPISCLNTVYKVISKLLANRLKSILPKVISNAQSAFLPGRLLAENVLLATDLVKGYKAANSEPKAMLKVDLRKAFDSVRWDFIIATLKALSIPEQFINWIVECISTPSFSVSVNGVSGGFFHSTRGVRQGDPLSPYLFVLAMESLSRLLQSRFDSGWISYHPKTAELNISHLMFADDVMIFFDGSTNSLHGVSECLDDFSSWSGLVVNTEKTELFTSGLSPTDSMAIARFGFPSGTLPVRYLGLPLSSRKLKISEYAPLIAKITTKFRMWASRSLSFSGRLVLLSSVIAGLVSFWISAFVLPKGCIRQIESLCTRFLFLRQQEVGI